MFKLFIAFLVCILFCVNVEAAKIAPVDTITTFPSSEESESSSDFSIGQKKIKSSVKDTGVDGLTGLNLRFSVPFKYKDYVLGLKYSIQDKLKSLPDEIFTKKSFSLGDAGNIGVDYYYNLDDEVFGGTTTWDNENWGLGLSLTGDSKKESFIEKLEMSVKQAVDTTKINLDAAYDFVSSKLSATTNIAHTDFNWRLSIDSVELNPVVAVTYDIDSKNSITPSIGLNQESSFEWVRKVEGGSVTSSINSDKIIKVDWTDKGNRGDWHASLEVPVENKSSSKLSLSRDWAF